MEELTPEMERRFRLDQIDEFRQWLQDNDLWVGLEDHYTQERMMQVWAKLTGRVYCVPTL